LSPLACLGLTSTEMGADTQGIIAHASLSNLPQTPTAFSSALPLRRSVKILTCPRPLPLHTLGTKAASTADYATPHSQSCS